MPLPVESLHPNSTDEEIKAASDASIAKCIEEGKPADQCKAIVNRYITDLTGKGSMKAGFASQLGGQPAVKKPVGGMGMGIGGAMP